MQTFGETTHADKANKASIMEAQQKLLASRYNLDPKFDPAVKMPRSKPEPMSPTARLVTDDALCL